MLLMSTVYQLFDLDYHIYVIRDCVLEIPPSQTSEVSKVMLDMLLPKMNPRTITIDEAVEALARS